MTPPAVSRRTLLLGGVALAAVGGGAGAWMATRQLKDYVADLLRFFLDGETFSEGAVEAFVTDYIATATGNTVPNATLLAKAAGVAGVGGLDALLSPHDAYDGFRRGMLTRFMLGSDFFTRTDPKAPIIWFGFSPVCGNPFARL